ncbi:MAG: hypothetical protein ABH956_01415 [Candidatus Nealsonbacteria bacterium]
MSFISGLGSSSYSDPDDWEDKDEEYSKEDIEKLCEEAEEEWQKKKERREEGIKDMESFHRFMEKPLVQLITIFLTIGFFASIIIYWFRSLIF